MIKETLKNLLDDLTENNDHSGALLVEAVVYGDLTKAREAWTRWVYREENGFAPSEKGEE